MIDLVTDPRPTDDSEMSVDSKVLQLRDDAENFMVNHVVINDNLFRLDDDRRVMVDGMKARCVNGCWEARILFDEEGNISGYAPAGDARISRAETKHIQAATRTFWVIRELYGFHSVCIPCGLGEKHAQVSSPSKENAK